MKKIILLSLFVLFLLSTNAKAITYTYHPYGSAVKCGLYKSSYLTGETMTINCIYEHDCYKPILAFPMHMYGTVNGVSKLVLDGPSFYLTDGCQYWYHSTLSNFVAPSVPGNYSVSIPFGYATLYLPYTVTASPTPTPPPPTPDTSGYNCNSSTGTCSHVSSGATYSSSSTCNANCSAPAPTCTASCTAWSACSVSCGGGTQSRTCTRTDCSTYTQSQACNIQACCVPSCSCALNTCVGNTCSDGCGGICNGTGTCTLSDYPTTSYSCSSNILTTTTRWYSYYCVSGGCSSPVLVDTNSSTNDCNTGEFCATGTLKSRCKDASTVEDYKEYNQGTCNQSGGRCDYSTPECDIVTTPCEEGYVCKETGTDQAECVPKATTWTEE